MLYLHANPLCVCFFSVCVCVGGGGGCMGADFHVQCVP